jgi:hypothetical protein
MLFGCHGLGTEAAAIFDDILCIAEEGRMTRDTTLVTENRDNRIPNSPMQVDFAVIPLVPFSVEKKVFGVQQLFNFLGVELCAIRDSEGI